MIISRTPYRLSLFGGGTDYYDWFETNPSKVITASMSKYSYITVRELSPHTNYNYLINYSIIEKTSDIDSIKHPSARETIRQYGNNKKIQVFYDGDLPARSGIGSSSTFTVGLINAICKLNNITLNKKELASNAIDLERNVLKESVGIQDQIAASFGGITEIKMGPGKFWSANHINLSKNYMKELENHILLGYSNISRYAEVQAKKKIKNIKNGKSKTYLSEISEIANLAYTIIKEEKDIESLGKMLDSAWQLKKKLAKGVTSDWIDTIYEKGFNSGAYGGKLMGAGGGGFFYFLAPPDSHEKIKKNIRDVNLWVPFSFDLEGSRILNIG